MIELRPDGEPGAPSQAEPAFGPEDTGALGAFMAYARAHNEALGIQAPVPSRMNTTGAVLEDTSGL